MKKTTGIILLLAMLLSLAALPAQASSPSGNAIHFTIIYGWPESQWTNTVDLDGTQTISTLRGYIRGLTGQDVWRAPGADDAQLGDFYGGYVTIDLTPPRPTTPPPYAYVVPEGYALVPVQPGQTAKPAAPTTKTDGNRTTYRNITASTIYLYQVYANNRTIDFRLFANGDKIAFLEKFGPNDEGDTRLTITIWQAYDDLKPVYTEEALDYLESLDVAEIEIRSKGKEELFTIEELRELL